MNSRDKALLQIIWHTVENGAFKASDLNLDVSESTRRDICQSLEEAKILQRETPNSTIWRAGPVTQTKLKMSDDAIEKALPNN